MVLSPVNGLYGRVDLPSDKSIAHRTMLLAALGDGTSRIVGYPKSADPQSTLACIRQLGIRVDEESDGTLVVHGRGMHGFSTPSEPLDCGNSGTTMRLLAGLLAGQGVAATMIGDASLSSRPMRRILDPLAQMGAKISATDGHAPLVIEGGHPLSGMTYTLPMASAQVKSCVLLAGLYADGETTVVEPVATRDHTERMLGVNAVAVGTARHLTVRGGTTLGVRTWRVPRDFSAAAFFLVAGSIVPEGEIRMPQVGLNPTRAALLDVLRAMGADIRVEDEREVGGEPIADLVALPAKLHGVRIDGATVANLIDEIPVLAVAMACAEGVSEVRDAHELRVKETDRIAAVADNLRAMGADIETFDDGFRIVGGKPLVGAPQQARHDHRIAMAAGIASLVAEGETVLDDPAVAAVSFPAFWDTLSTLRV